MITLCSLVTAYYLLTYIVFASYVCAGRLTVKMLYAEYIMNHNSGFIIGIRKIHEILIERSNIYF